MLLISSCGRIGGVSICSFADVEKSSPAFPRQLELGALTGTVRVKPGERLDFETQPEIDFVVIITSIDDASGTLLPVIGALPLSKKVN